MKDKIVHVRFMWPPIPTRDFDWCAYFDDDEEGGPHGFGKTPEKAIAELVEALEAANRLPAAADKPAPTEAGNALSIVHCLRPVRGFMAEIEDHFEELYAEVAGRLATALEAKDDDLRRLWHFAGCPYDHCQTCIDDEGFIKSLHERLGPPSARSVMARKE